MSKQQKSEEVRLEKMQLKKERAFQAECRKLQPYSLAALVMLLIAFLTMFLHFADIFNTDISGVEVAVNGFSFMIAGITRAFDSASKIYGDLAVPFYYYASSYCETLATMALIAFAFYLASAALQAVLFCRIRKNAMSHECAILGYACTVLTGITGILLIVCYAIGLSMNHSDILPIYCSGNPACSIRSFAILPALLLLIAAVINGITVAKYLRARKTLE